MDAFVRLCPVSRHWVATVTLVTGNTCGGVPRGPPIEEWIGNLRRRRKAGMTADASVLLRSTRLGRRYIFIGGKDTTRESDEHYARKDLKHDGPFFPASAQARTDAKPHCLFETLPPLLTRPLLIWYEGLDYLSMTAITTVGDSCHDHMPAICRRRQRELIVEVLRRPGVLRD
jgi:hypothetical protein